MKHLFFAHYINMTWINFDKSKSEFIWTRVSITFLLIEFFFYFFFWFRVSRKSSKCFVIELKQIYFFWFGLNLGLDFFPFKQCSRYLEKYLPHNLLYTSKLVFMRFSSINTWIFWLNTKIQFHYRDDDWTIE